MPREVSGDIRSVLLVLAARSDAELPVGAATAARRLHRWLRTRLGEHSVLGEAAGIQRRNRGTCQRPTEANVEGGLDYQGIYLQLTCMNRTVV